MARRASVVLNPQELSTARESMTPEEIDALKHFDCAYYEACLDVAVKENWGQFHCRDCKGYRPTPTDPSSLPSEGPWYAVTPARK